MASNVKKISVATTGDTVVATTETMYYGFTVRETAGVTAVIQIYDNASAASGKLLDSISLSAGESAREWYGVQGIHANNGIFFHVVSGTIEGSVRVG